MDAGSEHQRVEPAESRTRLGDEPLGGSGSGHVGGKQGRGAVRSIELLQIGGGHLRAFRQQPLHHGAADPAGRAGDEHAPSVEPAHQNGNTALQAATATSGSPLGSTSKVSCRS